MGVTVRLGVARSHRRRATRLAMLGAILGSLVVGIPAAVATTALAVEDAPAEAVITTDPTQPSEPVATADEPPPAPIAPSEPEPAPEEPAAVAPPPAPPVAPDAQEPAPVEPVVAPVEPPPAPAAASTEAPPPPPSAPLESTIRTPPAPQEPNASKDDGAVISGATTLSIASPNTPDGAQEAAPTGLGTKSAAPVLAEGTLRAFKQPAAPATQPLVPPMVQQLLPTTSAFAGAHAYPRQIEAGAVVTVAVEHASPGGTAEASPVQSALMFGGYVSIGGWSDQSAGLLAMLMGFLPLGLPDGKISMTSEIQLGFLLLGVLLVVVPFFASPIRDRRRRGPRGFATLALRPG